MANALVPNTASLPAHPVGSWAGPIPGAVEQLSLREFLRIIERYKAMILLIVGSVTLAVLGHQLTSPNLFQSTALVQVELIDEVGTNQADVLSRNQQRVANSVTLHRSRSSAEQVIMDLGLMGDPEFLKETEHATLEGAEGLQIATNTLLEMVEVSAQDGSDLLEVTVTSLSPDLAADIANQYPTSVRTVRDTKSNARRHQLLASLHEEQAARGAEAEQTAQIVADFRMRNRMLPGAGSIEDLTQINRLGAEAASAAAMRAGSAAQSQGISRASEIGSTAGASSTALEQLENQRAALLVEQSRLAANYGPRHPDVIEVTSQLDAVRRNIEQERMSAQRAAESVARADGSRMAELARSEAAGQAARADTLIGLVSGLESKAYQNTANSVELERLTRQAALADQSFKDIAARVESVTAQMQMEGVTSSIVSPAVPNYEPVSPAPFKMTAVALIGSAILAILIAFYRELVDQRLWAASQIRRNFGLPTFGMLPRLSGGIPDDLSDSPVIKSPQSLFAETARSSLAEVLALAGPSDKGQTILITSPLPGDGKSTVSLTLAAAGAESGLRTVVLDLDLRKRGLLQRVQNGLKTPDLVDIMTGRADLNAVIRSPLDDEQLLESLAGRTTDEERPRIMLLSAHEPVSEPAALLRNSRLRELVAELQTNFDLVIINAPAALAVRDARAMCEFAQDTIMVARWGETTIDQMNATMELLGNKVAGVIFDHVDYVEHARRRYGDTVQFYIESSQYYTGTVPQRTTLGNRLRRFFHRSAKAA